MTFNELCEKLCVMEGKLTLQKGQLTPNIDHWLTDCFEGERLIVSDATSHVDGEAIEIAGNSNAFRVTGLRVLLHVWVDDTGDAQIVARFEIGDETWCFSKSFPDLPQLEPKPYFDRFAFSAPQLIASSGQYKDVKLNTAFHPGLNFVGRLSPSGALGILQSFLDIQFAPIISGPIRTSLPAAPIPPLKSGQYPWDMVETPSFCGLILNTDLNLSADIGGIHLRDVALKAYSPPCVAFVAAHTTYRSYFSYTGRISIPQLNIDTRFVADYDPNGGPLCLDVKFQGVTLENLTSLAVLFGKADLKTALPEGLKDTALGRIELTQMQLDIGMNGSGLTLEAASVTVGLLNLNWQVWPEHFSVDNPLVQFNVSKPFEDAKLAVKVYGQITIEGVRVDVGAYSDEDFTLYAQLADSVHIPLRKLLSTYLPGAPVPSDLTIDALKVAVTPKKQYQMFLVMASEPNKWEIPLGITTLLISDVTLFFAYRSGGGFTGNYAGTLAFGDIAKLETSYAIPGGLALHAKFPEIKPSQLISTLSNQLLTLPSGFDLTFIDSSILIEKSKEDFHFLLGTQLKDFGLLAFEAKKVASNAWGFAVGLNLTGGLASTLPSLGMINLFENIFSLDKLVLVISSFKDTQFQFPDMDKFNDPTIAGGKISLPGSGGVVAGLNFYGQWTINTSDQQQGLLQKILGLDPSIGITLQVGGKEDIRLYVAYNTTISNHPLQCLFGGKMQNGQVGLFLEGDLEVEIQKQTQRFTVMLDFVTNGAYLSATVQGSTPIDFGWFKLGNLALEVGFNREGIPSFGIAGIISSGSFHSSIAVFFDSTNPSKSLVAGSISDLTLKDVFDSFLHIFAQENLAEMPNDLYGFLDQFAIRGTGYFDMDASLADALDNLDISGTADAFAQKGITIPSSIDNVFLTVAQQGETWFLTDLKNKMRHYQLRKVDSNGTQVIRASTEAQFYAAPQSTTIGALPTFDAGFYINAAIEFFGYHITAMVDIDYQKGFAFEAEMDKIVIGNETLFCVKAAQGEGGPHVSASTYDDAHLYINGKLSLLGLSLSCFINANKNGLVFNIDQSFLNVIKLKAWGTIGGEKYLDIGGEINVGIGTIDLGKLGKLNINTGVMGRLGISVSKDEISAMLEARFQFAGTEHSLGRIQLDVQTEALKNIAATLWEKVKAFFLKLFKDAREWALRVAQGFIEGVADMVAVLVDVFGIVAKEALLIVQEAFELAQKICSASQAVAML